MTVNQNKLTNLKTTSTTKDCYLFHFNLFHYHENKITVSLLILICLFVSIYGYLCGYNGSLK